MLVFAALISNAAAMEYQGQTYQGKIMKAAEFETALQNVEKALGYFYPPYWQSSAATCYATTVCPNGRAIHCQTYGYNHSRVPVAMSNSCRFMVLPGRAVRCQGYALQRNYYGQAFWGIVDIPVSCF